MDRRVDVRHFVHRRSCDISSSNMAAYERWPRVNGRGTKYSSEVCRMMCMGLCGAQPRDTNYKPISSLPPPSLSPPAPIGGGTEG